MCIKYYASTVNVTLIMMLVLFEGLLALNSMCIKVFGMIFPDKSCGIGKQSVTQCLQLFK